MMDLHENSPTQDEVHRSHMLILSTMLVKLELAICVSIFFFGGGVNMCIMVAQSAMKN